MSLPAASPYFALAASLARAQFAAPGLRIEGLADVDPICPEPVADEAPVPEAVTPSILAAMRAERFRPMSDGARLRLIAHLAREGAHTTTHPATLAVYKAVLAIAITEPA